MEGLLGLIVVVLVYHGYIQSKDMAKLRDTIGEASQKISRLENALYGVAYSVAHSVGSVAYKVDPDYRTKTDWQTDMAKRTAWINEAAK